MRICDKYCAERKIACWHGLAGAANGGETWLFGSLCRSRSVARAESHASKSVTGATAYGQSLGEMSPANGNYVPQQMPLAAAPVDGNDNDYEECLSCQ